VFLDFHRKILKGWKVWQLVSPGRWFKYNARNLTGDADAMFAGNPHAFKKIPQAVHDIWMAMRRKPTQDWLDWTARGGMESTLQAQEIDEFNTLLQKVSTPKAFLKIPEKLWRLYWKAARLSTDVRESLLRYAAYLDYKESMEKSPTNTPRNYGASMPQEILGLQSIEDRAFWLSNDLLGAYDRVSVMGQALREQLYPFWSWKEVNMKRYFRFWRNASQSQYLTTTIARKLVGKAIFKTPYMAYRVTSFVIKAVALSAALQFWNNYFFPDEEEDLPADIRSKPHIILGRDAQGNIQYFSRLGALNDLLEWFDVDMAPRHIADFLSGKKTVRMIAKDMVKAPLNIMVSGSEPFMKLAGELITRRGLYPDALEPRVIRDRVNHLARQFGFEQEVKEIFGKPRREYTSRIKNLFLYTVDPYEAAYWHIFQLKRDFMKLKGKHGEGFWLTESGNALYNAKSALKYGDNETATKYLAQYIELKALQGADEKAIRQGVLRSLRAMEPLYGLSRKDDEQAQFLSLLTGEDQRKLVMAYRHYKDILSGEIKARKKERALTKPDIPPISKIDKPDKPRSMKEIRTALNKLNMGGQ
jgi:hypothetical protein